MRISHQNIYRILDANINRTREGLRVVEEIIRFIFDNTTYSQRVKELRDGIKKIINEYLDIEAIKLARDTTGDVGRNTYTQSESQREEIKDLFIINMQRIEEALRVLEEFSKIVSSEAGESFKNLRYEAYILEKDILENLVDR